MTARRARSSVLALAALATLAVAAPRAALAQTKADAFAGKIPPVSGQLYRKAGRVELTATGNLSLNDAFYSKYFGGLKLGYHFTEAWSLSVQGALGATRPTGSAVVCPKNSGCVDANDAMLLQVPGKLRRIVGAELAWAPVYGKLNVFAEKVAHFDLSILAGADLISHDEVLGPSDAGALAASGKDPALVSTVGGHVGLGARLFLKEWLALRLEVKDYVYGVEVPNNGAGKDWQNQIFTELGLSFFFPFSNRPLP
ncbi:outer membrane beta-barrel domain-containing protein [Anaeromyxobacter sp. SG17]|uniref:outer membrane beta-barrel domain-containing protein n=1 Tax=Anaeromyxobacter sp. SG17 TaxID=2925405 RepID=UPI001F574EED|nr:outer membrane beta-barrel domain-containing protein [Anaeromyxobacter sp. SG17]